MLWENVRVSSDMEKEHSVEFSSKAERVLFIFLLINV